MRDDEEVMVEPQTMPPKAESGAPRRFAGLHPSGTILVGDSPRLFAEGVVRALSDDTLWRGVSKAALRHQRLLSPALMRCCKLPQYGHLPS